MLVRRFEDKEFSAAIAGFVADFATFAADGLSLIERFRPRLRKTKKTEALLREIVRVAKRLALKGGAREESRQEGIDASARRWRAPTAASWPGESLKEARYEVVAAWGVVCELYQTPLSSHALERVKRLETAVRRLAALVQEKVKLPGEAEREAQAISEMKEKASAVAEVVPANLRDQNVDPVGERYESVARQMREVWKGSAPIVAVMSKRTADELGIPVSRPHHFYKSTAKGAITLCGGRSVTPEAPPEWWSFADVPRPEGGSACATCNDEVAKILSRYGADDAKQDVSAGSDSGDEA